MAKEKETTDKPDNTENIIYIGKKPTMNYVLAVTTRFNSGSTQVTIKARGRSISTAVDVAEIVRNRFVQGLTVDNIRISTEVLEGEEGKTSNVSSIEIFLKK
jgi:DNA-binding protein